MNPSKSLRILHLTTHINIGGITSYINTLSRAMTKNGHLSSVVSSGGSGAMGLTRSGIRCYEYNIRTKSELNPKLFWELFQIARLVREEKFDILHAHSRVTQVLAFFLSKITGVPYVSTAHGFYKYRFGRKFFPAWGKKIIAISDLVEKELIETHHVQKEKVVMIYNAVDSDVFLRRLGQQNRSVVRSRFGIPKDAVVVGALSRLVRDKGHEFLLEAASQLLPKIPNLFVLIVGDGRELDRLKTIMKEKLPHHSAHLAALQDTTAFFSALDLFVHPATYREGFGLSIAEAMIAKIPVIATDIPAINTLIQDGVNGKMVKPADVADLACAMRDLIKNRKKAEELSEKAYDTATLICDPARMAREVESVYREVINGR